VKPVAKEKRTARKSTNQSPRRRRVLIVRGSDITFRRGAEPFYKNLDDYYREYRRNFLVRGAINARAFWATKEGFDTVVEPEGASQATELKAYVDRINAKVNLDNRLRLALIKAQIWGRAGFEVEFQKRSAPWVPGNEPVSLHSLKSTLLVPEVDLNEWKLTGFEYNAKKNFYDPGEVLFFVRNQLDDDWKGLSDVEPVLAETVMDDRIIREDLLEAATTLWAGVAVHQLDLEKAAKAGITDDKDIDRIMQDYRDQLRPGKHVITDDLWKIEVHDLKPDLRQLLDVSDKLERRILGNIQVPRFMLNIEKELNRATAYADLEAFVEGPITDDQRWLKRNIEEQWYDRLTRQFFKLKPEDSLPERVTHRWRQIRTADWLAVMDSASKAYSDGMGWISREKAYELMRDGQAAKFDPAEVQGLPPPPEPSPQEKVARELKRLRQNQPPPQAK
jgi:hypothetical protein